MTEFESHQRMSKQTHSQPLVVDEEGKSKILEHMAIIYPKYRPPRGLKKEKPDWDLIAIEIRNILRDGSLNGHSGVGYPYSCKWSNIQHWIDNDPIEIVLLVMRRLYNLMYTDIEDDVDGKDLYEAGCVDFIRMFIKEELHSERKIVNKVPRLIKSPSLVDKIVAIYLYYNKDKQEIRNWRTIPSKPGLDFTDSGFEDIRSYHNLMRMKGKTADSDMSNWDYTVGKPLLDVATEFRLMQMQGKTKLVEKLFWNFEKCGLVALYVTSDGFICERIQGAQDSGKQDTSSTNSFTRAFQSFCIAYLNQIPLDEHMCLTAGDDCGENSYDNSAEMYKRMGHSVKLWRDTDIDGGLHFCSRFYPNDPSEPVTFEGCAKTIGNLIMCDEIDVGMIRSRLSELRNNPYERNLLIQYLKLNREDCYAWIHQWEGLV
nr:RNA-dependent RNA polymerase [Flumine sobemo-like virus 33]